MAVDEGVTLRKLEVFLAFMKTGNMARASESLGLSVVSVHRALHSLEDSVRCALFKPDGRKLIPLMPYPYFKNMTAEDVDAVVAYLRTLKPVTKKIEPNPTLQALMKKK